jgi:multidrug efflux pump subunit AcrB
MKTGLSGKLANAFINSKLTPLLMAGIMMIGLYSVALTPREEEPQIVVPIADVFVRYPGASAEEVEARVSKPLEKIFSNIKGVEYVYSTSRNGMAMIIVRYYVGEDVEKSIVNLYNEISKNLDKMPDGVMPPLVKTRAIDDVPILGLTLWSETYDDAMLRRVASELSGEISKVPNVAEVKIIGGRKREVRVVFSKEKLAAYSLDLLGVMQQLKGSNKQMEAGAFTSGDKEYLVETGRFLASADEVGNLVVGVFQGNPVYLKSIASVTDGVSEPSTYVSFGVGAGEATTKHAEKISIENASEEFAAVTLSVTKRKGADAMHIAEEVLTKIDGLKGVLLPKEIHLTQTRNYGETASEKVLELLKHLLVAILAVTVFVGIAMGWRGGLVVFASVPITFALTLFVYYIFGYTLNRITLFALVFVVGIVVDDSIIIAENIHRHFKMSKGSLLEAAIAAVDEVGNPTILATFTVIAAVLPMIFVSGLMGPYMSPMPIGASIAMIFSLLVALLITPWLALRLLKNDSHGSNGHDYKLEDGMIYKLYSKTLSPLMENSRKRMFFLGGVTLLLLASMSLLYFQLVKVKMLPFDNKNEFQVIIDMPEGTTLERTAAVTREIAAYLKSQPEVVTYQSYVGTAAPINFNGLVRQYDLRRGANVADIQVNLTDKSERSLQSHDIAKRVRAEVQKIGATHGANVKVAEVPPGPPVLSTLVVEIFGPNYAEQQKLAAEVKTVLQQTDGVVDVDWMVEADQTKYRFDVDKRKAMLAGVNTEHIANALAVGLNGMSVGKINRPSANEPVEITLRLDESERSSLAGLRGLAVQSNTGKMIPMSELVTVTATTEDKSIYRKNQQRVVYVTADVAGKMESPVYAILAAKDKLATLPVPQGYKLEQRFTKPPLMEEDYTIKWDGEWFITYEVFRDLGVAFAVALIVIYLLIIGWFQSFKTPIIMMISIPLSLVGILVGHWIFGAFFTATSMIGTIALAGVMVRNGILLIDFIEMRIAEGVPLKYAIIESGAVRTTPILLTAGTVILGAVIILFDPIFQGLAIALMGGSIASTFLTLLVVPLVFYMSEKNKPEHQLLHKPITVDVLADTEEFEELNKKLK